MLIVKFLISRKERERCWTPIMSSRYQKYSPDKFLWVVCGVEGPEEVSRKIMEEIKELESFDELQQEAFAAAFQKCFQERRKRIRFRVRKTKIKDRIRYIVFQVDSMEVVYA